jgi:hypothetical protein
MKTVSHLQKLLIGYILSTKKILNLDLLFPMSKFLKAGVFEDFRDIGTKTDNTIETNGLYR